MQRNDARNRYTSTDTIESISGWKKLQDWTMYVLAMFGCRCVSAYNAG